MSSSPRTVRLVPDLHKWTATILAYCKRGHNEKAIALYYKLWERAIQPDGHAFVAALKACGGAEAGVHGRVVHGHIVETISSEGSIFVGNSLVDVYIKCGYLEDAHTVFNKMATRDVVTWNTMIAGCCQLASLEMGLQLWQSMQHHGIEPDTVTYACILKACSGAVAIQQGMMLHNHIFECSLEQDLFIGSSLIAMYAQSACLLDARRVFDQLTKQSRVVWNTIISGYAKNGDGWETLHLFEQMQHQRVEPCQTTFVCTLKACSVVASLQLGKLIHSFIIEHCFDANVFINSSLIDMYARRGSLDEACNIFRMSKKKDTVVWNALINGLIQNGNNSEALSFLRRMKQRSSQVSCATLVCVLRACSSLRDTDEGKIVHAYMIESGYESDMYAVNALIDMYIKCHHFLEAQRLFDGMQKRDMVTWNTLIAGYVQNSLSQVLWLFQRLQQEGIKPDQVTYACVLKACSRVGALHEGKLVHCSIIEGCSVLDVLVDNALIYLYSKWGNLDDAHYLFSHMIKRDVVTWVSMCTGLIENGQPEEALLLFQKMVHEGINLNQGAFVSLLKACASTAALDHGKLTHAYAIDVAFESDVSLGNTLVDMYVNCGCVEDACIVFHKLQLRDFASWTAMIAGFGHHNKYDMALHYFEVMQQEGLQPNDVTFICLLTICSHLGFVEEACRLIRLIMEHHITVLSVDHYNCLVDLFGRAKQLDRARDLLVSMPYCPTAVGWSSLLSHCRTHGNLGLGKYCFDTLLDLDQCNASAYVLMAGIYMDSGMQDDANKIMEMKKGEEAWKEPGKALIEIGVNIHNFVVGDNSHLYNDEIVARLKSLHVEMTQEGVFPYYGHHLTELIEENDREVFPIVDSALQM